MSAPDTAFIAGGSSDIGRALIEGLLKTSPELRVVAHYHGSSQGLLALQERAGGRLQTIQGDFSSIESVVQLTGELTSRFGLPSKVVYLPGLKLKYERFSKFDLRHFDLDMTVQVRSAAAMLSMLAPRMAKLPRARIVFVLSSVTRGVPPKFMSMYSVVKHAQLGLMRSLASEYASTALTVNAVSPSMVETRFLDDIPGVAKELAASAAPRGRLATPREVSDAIEYLLSAGTDALTGVELPVAGG